MKITQVTQSNQQKSQSKVNKTQAFGIYFDLSPKLADDFISRASICCGKDSKEVAFARKFWDKLSGDIVKHNEIESNHLESGGVRKIQYLQQYGGWDKFEVLAVNPQNPYARNNYFLAYNAEASDISNLDNIPNLATHMQKIITKGK